MLDTPSIDLDMSARFLTALAGKDAQFVFQTFCNHSSDEGVSPKNARKGIKPMVLVGTLSKHANQLEQINKGESGVFVVINETDGGRNAASVTHIRALFADWDVVDTGLPAIATCGLKPHIIIESSIGKFHAYWLVDDCQLEEFKPLQIAIAKKLNSDPAINNKDRVMRLPGFTHHKYADSPYFQTRIVEFHDMPHYTVEGVKQGLGISTDSTPKTLSTSLQPICSSKYRVKNNQNKQQLDKIRLALASIPLEFAENRDSWREVAMSLHSESDVLFDDFLMWSEGAKNHDADACEKLWDSFSHRESGGITIRTLFRLAIDHGWMDNSQIIQELTQAEPLSDVGNARRLVRLGGGNIRYCVEAQAWIFWDASSGRWKYSKELIMRLAEDTTFKMTDEASEASSDPALYVAILKHALKSQSLRSLKAQIELAQTVQGIPVALNQLDADPYLLNVLNGTINLKTGLLRDVQREDLITKQAHVIFDKTAQCPTWLSYLNRVFASDKELISFMQRAIGYSLTGLVSEQVMFVNYGFGANGKSVLLNVITGLLGDHASNAQSSSIMMQKNDDSIKNDLARLRGSRFVSMSEIEDGKRLAEAQLKQLTGGDPVTARFLYKEHFEFNPMFKLWMACNHRPVISGTDAGIWRRILLIPFNVTIPESERDGKLLSRLAAEYSGILNWALQGCLAWQEGGLAVPDVIKNAVANYQVEMDSFGQWLSESCDLKPSYCCMAGGLYANYREWAETNGFHIASSRTFGQKLTERGFSKRKSNGVVYEGLKLLTIA